MMKACLIPFLVAVSLDWLCVGNAFVVQPSLSPSSSSRERRGRQRIVTKVGTTIIDEESTTNDDDVHEKKVLSLPMFINEAEELGKRPESALDPDTMIVIAKIFLASNGGLGGDPALLSPSFTFEGPVVGPLGKSEFVDAIGSVDFKAAFPDFTSEFYGFHVDPFEGDRVWYTARGKGKNTGPLLPFIPEKSGTGITVVNPPQVCSITIEHTTGLISKYTIGYVVDRTIGNTDGLGGLYGILHALGRPLPFPEAQPWKKSMQYDLFQKIGGLLQKLQ